jgi:hypothetical protein
MKTYLLAVFVVVLALGAWLAVMILLATQISPFEMQDSTTEAQWSKAIDIAIDTSKLLMSWSIVLVGAIGALLAKLLDAQRPASSPHTLLAVAAVTFAILSLLSGFFYLQSIAGIIAYRGIRAAHSNSWILATQFLMLFLAVVCGGTFFLARVLYCRQPHLHPSARHDARHSPRLRLAPPCSRPRPQARADKEKAIKLLVGQLAKNPGH